MAKKQLAPVCFATNDNDALCIELAMLGFSMKHISKETGYSFGQISYRLREGEVKLADYRQGKNEAAKAALLAINNEQ
jgi:hypothetical protein